MKTISDKNTTGVVLRVRLHSEWYRDCGLSTVLGFDNFEEYVSDCIENNVYMYLMGGDDIDKKFRSSYKHLVYEDKEQDKQQQQQEQTDQKISKPLS